MEVIRGNEIKVMGINGSNEVVMYSICGSNR
jgi:hypothetical protein